MTQRIFALCLLGAAFAVGAVPAHADRDAVSFGSNINVARDSSVHDAVCFFCGVNAEGEVDGDLVVFFGNVHIAGAAHHDVVNFFGNVQADDGASVGQNLVSMFGAVRLGENVSIGKDLVAMFGSVHAPDSVTVRNNRVVEPCWVFWGPLLIFGLVIIVVVRELRAHRRRQMFSGYPFPPNQ